MSGMHGRILMKLIKITHFHPYDSRWHFRGHEFKGFATSGSHNHWNLITRYLLNHRRDLN